MLGAIGAGFSVGWGRSLYTCRGEVKDERGGRARLSERVFRGGPPSCWQRCHLEESDGDAKRQAAKDSP